MTPKEKALDLCQRIGVTTLFADDCNGGVTLPLRVSKLIAILLVLEIENYGLRDIADVSYWADVKKEITQLCQ
jgi:hypothetical protein